MSIGSKLKELRAARGWTQDELAKRSGMSRGYIANLEKDMVDNPSAAAFLRLARAFNIQPEELYQSAGLIRDVKIQYQIKETHEEIIDRLRLASPVSIPVYGELHAGSDVFMEPLDYIYMAREDVAGKNIQAFMVSGTCLSPDIKDGDIVIVNRVGDINTGDIIAALCNDELKLGRFRKLNEEYWIETNDDRIKYDDCSVKAPVIQVIRKLK